jgi:PilZ domain
VRRAPHRKVATPVIVNQKPERRRSPRLEILGRIQGIVRPLDVPIRLLNLGLGGFLMQTPNQFAIGEIHEFQFTVSKQDPIVLRARIAHAMRVTVDHVPLYAFGLEFVDGDTPAGRAAIESLVSVLEPR